MEKIPNKQVIVGTAGHIDHGKTTLVYRLTGIDADRWEEEKKRGITIDIGFAHMDSPEVSVSFIDVPGHKDFVTNMLAGVHSLDFAILIVAADESVMPQTKEHFDILRLLGIKNIFPVITKIDLVDNEMVDFVVGEIEELYENAGLRIPEFFKVSAKTGEGIEELKSFLFKFAEKINNYNELRPSFLNVDRSFTIKGFGTVITGTLMSGSLQIEDEITVLPSGKKGKIRNINTHNTRVEKIYAKKRAALNLPSFKKEEITRGDFVLKDNLDIVSHVVDAKIKIIGGYSVFKDLTRVRVNIGTADVIARVKLLENREEKVPFEGYCQLRFESPVACYWGERFIIRHFSPLFTVGGGVILDNKPKKRKGFGKHGIVALKDTEDFSEMAVAVVEEEGYIGFEQLRARVFAEKNLFEKLVKKLKQKGKVIVDQKSGTIFSPSFYSETSKKLLERLDEFHKQNPRKEGMPLAYLSGVEKNIADMLVAKGKIVKEGEILKLPGFKGSLSGEEEKEYQRLLETVDKGGLTPPMINVLKTMFPDYQLLKDFLKRGMEEGKLVRINSEFYLSQENYRKFMKTFKDFSEKFKEFTIQDIKPVFNISRRYLVALLEYLDGERITVKVGGRRKIIG